ncbi:MAG: thiamine pyrophosphate-binding protein [Acidisphaera sp.]|nr:thiamine pyrophosphate-binding protein [Acidisphaera sp.]
MSGAAGATEMPPRGADLVMQALAQVGVRTVFALSGNHIMPLFDAALDTGVRLVHVRHEAAAVHMADAWARLTGEVGVAMVTGGPGMANAVGALYTCLAGESPMLLLSGHAALSQLGDGAFQELRQAALAEPVAKASWLAASAAGLPRDIARAIRVARAGRPGPVHVALPVDLLDASPKAPALPDAGSFVPEARPLAEAAAHAIIAALGAARRPLIIAPPALCSREGRRLLAGLAEATGVPVIAMESPRGVNDPSLGALPEMLASADLIVLAGKPLDYTLGFGKPPTVDAACRWIVIDPDPALIARAARRHAPLLAALADPAAAVTALSRAAGGRADPGWRNAVATALARRPPECDTPPEGALRHPAAMCRALRGWLKERPDTVFVSDGGEVGQWAQAMLAPEERLINGVAGAIGPAIPYAVAAKLARPAAPVLAVLGDGTTGFHLSEFDTAARYRLPFVAVIGNDARWNAEYQIQLRAYGADRVQGCTLSPETRYDRAVVALGGHGEFVGPGDDLPAALRRAFASDRPACVNVVIESSPTPTLHR